MPRNTHIPPEIYSQFVQLCQECAGLERQKHRMELRAKVGELRRKCWFWTRGPMETFIEQQLKEELGKDPPPELVTFAVRQLWQTVTRAAHRNATPEEQAYLYPLMAADVAVASAVASVR